MSQHWFPLFLFLVLLPLASPFSQPLKTGPTRPRGGRSGPETGNGNPIDPDEMNLAAAIQDDPVPEAQDDPILNNHAKNETSECKEWLLYNNNSSCSVVIFQLSCKVISCCTIYTIQCSEMPFAVSGRSGRME